MVRAAAALVAAALAGWGADQTGNQAAAALARRSPAIQTAKARILDYAGQLKNPAIRAATLDALQPGTCVTHRVGLTPAKKEAIVRALVAAHLAEPGDALVAGVFPPLIDEGSSCPKLPQLFESAPGSAFGGHHSYPGGLAIHECFNLLSGLNFGQLYDTFYGPGPFFDRDLLIAAPIWHDWAKAFVFQWNADGTEFDETTIAGTGAHHILGLAETMKRSLPTSLILAQASAHAAPILGNEGKVEDWLRVAAIIAQVDPIKPAFRTEYAIHTLSDADFIVSIPAMKTAEALLKELAGEFGYNAAIAPRYNLKYRNPALSFITAERIAFLGRNGTLLELRNLRASGVI